MEVNENDHTHRTRQKQNRRKNRRKVAPHDCEHVRCVFVDGGNSDKTKLACIAVTVYAEMIQSQEIVKIRVIERFND